MKCAVWFQALAGGANTPTLDQPAVYSSTVTSKYQRPEPWAMADSGASVLAGSVVSVGTPLQVAAGAPLVAASVAPGRCAAGRGASVEREVMGRGCQGGGGAPSGGRNVRRPGL
jgi:hypothetical protein